jgi:hypothetical protein
MRLRAQDVLNAPHDCFFAASTVAGFLLFTYTLSCSLYDDPACPEILTGLHKLLVGITIPSPMNLIRSKKRVADHGEVLTPAWLVENMLDLVKGETERIDSRFLEPACGSGNFLVPVLQRKLAAVETKYGKSDFERRHYALLAVMCAYGIELLADNIVECRERMLEVFADYLTLTESDELFLAAAYVLSQNLVNGNALTMRAHDGQPITFAEWGYLGKGKFQRRDFRFDVLMHMSSLTREGSLFAGLGKHEVFIPDKEYPPVSVADLACCLVAIP